MPELKSLSSKLELITDVGYREGAGHRLVSEAVAAELEKAWRDELRARAVDDLMREGDLLRVLLIAKHEADASEPPIAIPDVPKLTLAVLRAAHSEVRSQFMGSRAVRRSWRLAWDALLELYGDEAALRERIESLEATGPSDAEDVLELADKYLGGWRPNDFGDS